MQSAVTVGEQVMLTSGIFGTVTDMDDDKLSLEIAPGVIVRVARGAVGSIVPSEEPEPETEPETELSDDAESENN
jgi:preprotein translocase subunit YajC